MSGSLETSAIDTEPQQEQRQLHTPTDFYPFVPMDSSGPVESFSNLIAAGGNARYTRYPIHRSQAPPGSSSSAPNTAIDSTPMPRSMTNNPAISSSTAASSNIAAATSGYNSVSIAVSSSPLSSIAATAASTTVHTTHASPMMWNQQQQERVVTANSTPIDSPSERRHQQDATNREEAELAEDTNRTYRRMQQADNSQHDRDVDERIHFRLLNNIYFSAHPRQPRHDDNLSMDSPILPRDRSEPQYIDAHEASSSDQEVDPLLGAGMEALEYHDIRQHREILSNQAEEYASAIRNRRANHSGLTEEEREANRYNSEQDDDEDDGIDQVMDDRFRHGSLSATSQSSSPLERPQHAQLSPRSAAALTSMFSIGNSPWSQSSVSASISSDLNAHAHQGMHQEYDSNPYFRRLAPVRPPRISSFQQSAGPESRYNIDLTQRQQNISIERQICGENIPVASNDSYNDVWPLKFDMYYADGGEFNAAHSVENVLKNDSSVYCSRRQANINICLKLSEPHRTFVLTQFKAKAPTTGFTAPCKEGLIFISHEPIALEKTALFDNMTREHYEEYMERINQGSRFSHLLKNHGSDADALLPAAFFQLNGPEETCTLDFNPNRSGRYVLIKLLRSRCTNSLQRPENIDLQYLGLIGKLGADFSFYFRVTICLRQNT
ncbi:hypothetical protein BGZ51_004192 [Haplosporangium sp. Z 767]|nr:hypothetical protein BGZ51_004192 [Haplosporangium sp. Z 767]